MRKILFLSFLAIFNIALSQEKVYLQTVAFYNVENLFHPDRDTLIRDEEYTPEGRKKWTDTIYTQKINNIASVIAEVGKKETLKSPVLVGVAEIENVKVLEALIHSDYLRKGQYEIVHFDSKDFRGIDVALLYQKNFFTLMHQKKYALRIVSRENGRYYPSRDILVVGGYLEGEPIFVLVNHWPSRRGGQKRSTPNRVKAAYLHKKITDSILRKYPEAKIISMGDYNDGPKNESLGVITKDPFFNPYLFMKEKGLGSLAYRDNWFLFDQIILSKPFKEQKGYFFYKSKIFNPNYLRTPSGKYKNYPYRTQVLGDALSGYSDHFPVYVILAKKVKE